MNPQIARGLRRYVRRVVDALGVVLLVFGLMAGVRGLAAAGAAVLCAPVITRVAVDIGRALRSARSPRPAVEGDEGDE